MENAAEGIFLTCRPGVLHPASGGTENSTPTALALFRFPRRTGLRTGRGGHIVRNRASPNRLPCRWLLTIGRPQQRPITLSVVSQSSFNPTAAGCYGDARRVQEEDFSRQRGATLRQRTAQLFLHYAHTGAQAARRPPRKQRPAHDAPDKLCAGATGKLTRSPCQSVKR